MIESLPAQRPTVQQIQHLYKDRLDGYSRKATQFGQKGRQIENLRGVSFAGMVIGAGYYFAQHDTIFGLVALLCCVAFAGLVQYHGQVLKKEAHYRRFSIVNEHGHQRASGTFHALPRAGSNFAPADHLYADDLDLFGVGSLYQRLSVAHTRYGQRTLAEWLCSPASLDEIAQRQAAVLELSQQTQFRQELEAEGMALVEKRRGKTTTISDGPNPARLLKWVSEPGKIAKNPVVIGLSWVIPLATLTGFYAYIYQNAPPYVWLIPLIASVVLLGVTKSTTAEAFEAVSTTEGAFLRYGTLLEIIEKHEVHAPWLKQLHQQLLGVSETRPSVVMRRFRNIVSWYDFRHNGMVYPFINAVLQWDIHCTAALERWKKNTGKDLNRYFEIIGQYEALSSLAGLHADDPNTNMPTISDPSQSDSGGLHAKQLGHPLLPPSQRVSNDVEEFGVGQALLVTGSNMSGKSTFLRALGVNAVLAFAGGPVVAKEFSLPLCQLATSIRVSDSLKSGVSHFYAEVQKLAQVVQMTEQGPLPVFFLLDEVLHGTNSRERQIGARWTLAELLKNGAFGIITTHDMELCRLPEALMKNVRQHHFRESVHNDKMSFDYTLREGAVTSGNALRLMRRVGLAVPLEPPPNAT